MGLSTYNPGKGFTKGDGYGWRVKPGSNTGEQKFHSGVDYAALAGTEIPAAADGDVVYSGYHYGGKDNNESNAGYGNTVIVQSTNSNGEQYYTLYAHQNGDDMKRVGDHVEQGKPIGRVGSTGGSTGAHLHFEVLNNKFRIEKKNQNGGIGKKIGFDPKDQSVHYDPDKFYFENKPKDIEITISDVTANETNGKINFTVNINKTLDEDFTFNISTKDGSAKETIDYVSALNVPITIKKGDQEKKHSISIISDDIYEISEDFMVYSHYEKGTYKGSDLGNVKDGTGVGTITDNPVGSCPVMVAPNVGLSFTAPTPLFSAVSGGGGGGGVSYYGGSGGGGYGGSYTPSVYTGSSTQAPVILPNVPIYECHSDLKLFSVAIVSLPVACNPSTPPLVFDLNHDGVTSLSMAASLALFDYNADNSKEHTAWIQNGDALLVRDTNNDGLITNGSELFGDHTLKGDGTTATNGYDALNEYDTNKDGIINATDEHFNELKLWKDNGDGITEQGELKTLSEENITSITLPTSTPTPVTEEGNTITNASTYTQTDGITGDVKDVWFTYENIASETYFDTDGDGFSEKMDSWMDANQGVLVWDKNKDGKINSGKEIIGTNMLLPNGKTTNDSFSALNAFDTNHDGIIDTKDTAGLAIWKDTNKNGQTDAGELLQIGAENSLTSINLNPYQNMLSGYDRNHDMVINSSDAIYNYMYQQENGDGTISIYLPNNADAKAILGDYIGGESIKTSQGTKTLKEVIFYDGELPLNDTLQGTAQNDKLTGNKRSNMLYGNDGRDILDAKEGNDTLVGGKGDDYLLGGKGDDTYVYKKGDGVDLVEDSDGNDTIKFGEGISKNDLIIKTDGKDIIIGLKTDGVDFNKLEDRIIIKDWYQTSSIDTLQFSDGSTMNSTEILQSINVNSKVDSTVKFDGTDDAMVIPSSNSLNASTALTVYSKFSYEGMGTGYQSDLGGMIVSKHYTHNARSYDLSIGADGKLVFDVINSNDVVHIINSNTILKVNQTYDLAATYDKATGMAKLYINGVLDNEVNVGSFDIMQTSVPVVIGAYCLSNDGSSLRSFLKGTVNDVQIYDQALSSSDITKIVNGEIVSNGLVAHYDFDGNPLIDKSGNGNTAIIRGNPTIQSEGEITYDTSSYQSIAIDNQIVVDNTKTLAEAGQTELVLQTGYTGAGTSGTTAQTTTQGAGYTGTLQNNWFKNNALDTKYIFEGKVSADIQALPNIKGQGAIRDLQHVMSENQTLTDSVSAYKAKTATTSFSDLDSQMNDILAQWVQLDNYGGINQATPPIVLDLNGNGITSTSLEGSNAYFDYDGNGRRELTAWSEKEDALLVIDRNSDGIINDGSELFGTYSKLTDGSNAQDGYAALSMYDSNNDKVIDINDVKFNDLRLWQDVNQNGKSEAGELKTLTEMGVVSLGLKGNTKTSTENGNTISGETAFTTATGTTGVMRDVWFNYSDKHSIAVSDLSDDDEKKLAIVEAFLGKKLTAIDRANPYVINSAFDQYNTLKYDAMAKMFSNELYGKNFTACRFMYEALNNTLARI